MPLVHRTNYEGTEILASEGRGDKDLKGLEVIWAQFSTSKSHASCCFSFGTRSVFIRKGALVKDSDDCVWNLYLVNEHPGRHGDHYFYKFALIPSGTRNFGKKTCMQQHDWEWVGSIYVDSDDFANSPLKDLYSLLRPYYEGEYKENGNIVKYHVHVGICMESLIAFR